jgi:SAM-dependent methyltransferase
MDVEEHAARFDGKAGDYDSEQSEEYRACAALVAEHASPESEEVVLDVGTGTGAIAFELAGRARRVIGRDVSDGMLERAREKADERGVENVSFGRGRFRDPGVPEDVSVDVVTSNFAMHHISDGEKREAIAVAADLEPRRFVLGDVMLFGEPDPDEPFYSPAVDDPATVGVLANAFTDAGFVLTAVEQVHEQVGVIVGERPTEPTGAAGDRR